MSMLVHRGGSFEGSRSLQHVIWILLGVLVVACSSTEQVLEKGACVRATQLPASQAALVARVDRALVGTDADRTAANVRLVTTADLVQMFPRELAAHAAVCGDQQAKPGDPEKPGEGVCDGAATPQGTLVLVCSTVKTTCVYIVTPAGPATSCGPTPSQPA
jgi:hypothetical protein